VWSHGMDDLHNFQQHLNYIKKASNLWWSLSRTEFTVPRRSGN
jgi:hypothetical protein